jgi:hypothetical protein
MPRVNKVAGEMGKVYFLERTRHVLEIALESGILLSIFRRFPFRQSEIPSI